MLKMDKANLPFKNREEINPFLKKLRGQYELKLKFLPCISHYQVVIKLIILTFK